MRPNCFHREGICMVSKKRKKRTGILAFIFSICLGTNIVMADETVLEENGYTLRLENYGDFEVSSDYMYTEDTDWDWSYLTVNTMSAFAKGEKGYYVRLGEYVYFCSFEQGKLVPLCNRPDCMHDRESDAGKKADCIAYVGFGRINEGLQFYNNKLYANVDSGFIDETPDELERSGNYLYEISADGSQRELLRNKLENSYQFVLHRGSVYYTSLETDPETLITTETVYRLTLKDNKLTKIVQMEGRSPVLRVYPYGDYVYITTLLAEDEEVPRIIYDINTEKVKTEQEKWQCAFIPDENGSFLECTTIEANVQKAEYVRMDGSGREEIGNLVLDDLARFGFEEDQSAALYNWISTDDSYIYIFGEVGANPVTAVFDRQTCELLQVLPMESMPPYQCIGVDDQYLFYSCELYYSGVSRVYWMEKKDMLEPGAQFQMMEP